MSDSDNEVATKIQMYTLVRFIHRGRKKQVESIDIVPSKWLDFDSHRSKCVTKYMQPPYNEEDLKLIQTLTVNNVDAPEGWPVFSVELKGRAETYVEALKKIKRLECEEHVLTLDSEDSASEVRKQLTKDIKRKKLLAEARNLKTKTSAVSTNNDDSHNENKSDMEKDDTMINKRILPPKKSWLHPTSMTSKQSDTATKPLGQEKENDELVQNSKANESEVPSEELQDFPLSSEPQLTTSEVQTLEDLSASVNNAITTMQLANVDCMYDFQSTVLMQLEQISNHLTSIKDQQNEMAKEIASIRNSQDLLSYFLLDKKIISKATAELENKYQIAIPIPTYEDFMSFEEKLKSDKYFKNDVYLELRSQMDKDCVLTKSIVKMLKKFLTKEVASMFTAIRSSSINKSKQKFKPTQLCTIIYGTITKVRSEKSLPTEIDDLDTALTDVLSNVNKWKT